jgi:hypothetical protein
MNSQHVARADKREVTCIPHHPVHQAKEMQVLIYTVWQYRRIQLVQTCNRNLGGQKKKICAKRDFIKMNQLE